MTGPVKPGNRVVIAIGSNIEPIRHIDSAIAGIAGVHRVLAQTQLVRTSPIGPIPQDDYLNGAILIETQMDADELKAWLQRLENQLGRDRTGEKFGPRTIDLDIVVWNGLVTDDDVRQRDFLLQAVLELCPRAKGV